MDVSQLLTGLVTLIGTLVAYKPLERAIGKVVDRWGSSHRSDDKELSVYRRRDASELVELRARVAQLESENNQWQERYYEQRQIAAVAVKDVEHYQRLAQVSISTANRGALAARRISDALPEDAPGSMDETPSSEAPRVTPL